MKTLCIVGASDGIGKETAALFLRENYRVLNLSRTPCDLPGVVNLACDVADRSALDEALKTVQNEDRLDVFVYSAGFSMACPLEYVQEGDYRYLFEVNFFAYLHCLRTLLPALKKTEGVACVVGSLAALLPIPFDCYYSASKAALNALTNALSYELETENVRVLCAMPAGTKTSFTAKRKIYSPAAVDGYSKQMTLACDSLKRMEQGGASAKRVAKKIFFACRFPPRTPVFAVPLLSEFYALAAKLLPACLLRPVLRASFFTEEE